GLRQLLGEVVPDVDARDPVARLFQRRRAGLARAQAYLAFGREAAKQHGHVLEPLANPAHGVPASRRASPMGWPGRARPRRMISQGKAMPETALTRARTVSPSRSISSAVAAPSLIKKLQCISETLASPMRKPRQPAWSISFQALACGGFLKVEP